MPDPFLNKKFIFNDDIDKEFLFSLYEDDYSYIQEIFQTTIDQVQAVMEEIPRAFESKNDRELKKMIHKIKPAFGFTGFIKTEKACNEFEEACADAIGPDRLSVEFDRLWPLLVTSMQVMQAEHNKLKEFNNL
jgi:HPt (histidine-containing phosphotransfer) domain-containing protein